MKLNNRGWGLSTMIILLLVLVIFLLLAAIISYNIVASKNSPIPLFEENNDDITEYNANATK